MNKEKIHVEYIFDKASKNALWNYLTTSTGLSEWFADEVHIHENEYTFIWDKSPAKAELLVVIPNNTVRFKWVEDETPDSYVEFKLHTDEITGAIVLEITDFADPEEKEDTVNLWDSQVKELKRILGI
ncbi:MAG: START-like domain-containing protein [Candidatus Azobacteroides sp.]|nr:START-like domain-containing protein [Candidatus Azobacteroides sp.]